MDEIESLILAAWKRVVSRLTDDPELLAQRIARRRRPTLMRPPRAWCIAIRASDHRIAGPFDRPREHTVTLSRSLLNEICAPVRLDAPGEPPRDAAKKLGTTAPGLHGARFRQVFNTHYIAPTGGRGRPTPLLYTAQPLDPCAMEFAQQDAAWGWTATYLPSRLPRDFTQTITRIPYLRPHVPRHHYAQNPHPELDAASPRKSRRLPSPPPDYVWYKWSRSGHYLGDDPHNWRKGPEDLGERPPMWRKKKTSRRRSRTSVSASSLHFAGFRWLCPVCGKSCRTLYCPVPPIHLLAHAQPRVAKCVDVPRKLTGVACRSCHRVRFMSRVAPDTWNQLIAYLTAGLLYGREVPKPGWFTPQRKRAYHPKPNARPALRRQQILRRLLNGWTLKHIADDMRLKPLSVHNQMQIICRQEGVADREELARKLGSPHPQPLNRNQLVRKRRDTILQLILQGRTNQQIREQLGMTRLALNIEKHKLYRAHGVHDRRELEQKFGVTRIPSNPRRDEIRSRRAAGQSYRQIAAALGISFWTVHNHVKAINREERTIPPDCHAQTVSTNSMQKQSQTVNAPV